METFLILCLLAILLAGWIYFRKRLAEMDSPISRHSWTDTEANWHC